MGISQSANAQNWQGHAPADVIVTSSTTKADDDHILYLYNPKTGLFLNLGGYWGTQPGLHEVGIPLKLVATDGGRYKICTGIVSKSGLEAKDWCIGYVRDIDTGSKDSKDYNNFYVDRLGVKTNDIDYDGLVKATLTQVGTSNTYTISFYDYGYNHVTEDGADQTVGTKKVYTYTSTQHQCVGTLGSFQTVKGSNHTTTFTSETQLSNDDLANHQCGATWTYKSGRYSWDIECTATPGYSLTSTTDEEIVPSGSASSTKGQTLYFAANAATKGVDGVENKPTDGSADWVIVTLADLKAEFKDKPASDAKPADATFLLKDQNFNRNNSAIGSWKSFATPVQSPKEPADNTFYVGNGVKALNVDPWTDYNDLYGQYWTANIINGGNGKVSQDVQIYREGWYRVRCKGFVSMASGSKVTAKLYATCSSNTTYNNTVSANLNVLTAALPPIDEETEYASKFYEPKYTRAGKAFKANLYNNDLLIYVEGATDKYLKTLTIGVDVAKSIDGDWICFDDVQLQYCGKGDLVLDEDRTSVYYMNRQVDANSSYTLILKRTTTKDKWNSLVLPVALTAQQFKTAFGDDAKLSKLEGVVNNGTRIQFKSVRLTNDTTKVVKPGQLYIMKPSKDANVQEGSYTKKIGDNDTITVYAPYYTINNITLKSQIEETKTKFQYTPKDNQTEDGSITFWGTYLNSGTENMVPAGSFGLGAKDGIWYHSQNALPIKGFRCWIATQKNAGAKVSFSIDDEDMGVVTAIEGIETAPILRTQDAVYTLSGQKVRSSQSLEGLPKGIYIINNKKVIVK